jgi:hypothetical protein
MALVPSRVPLHLARRASNFWVLFKNVFMVKRRTIGGGGHDPFRKGISHKKIPQRMPFAVPICLFKSLSIIFRGADLIFEGLTNRGGCRRGKFCQGLPGVNPQRSNQSVLLRDPFGRGSFRNRQGPHSDDLPWPKALRVYRSKGEKRPWPEPGAL